MPAERIRRTALPILFFAFQMFAQRSVAPAFEVATIKPAVPISSDDFRSGKARPGLMADASQVRIRYWALSNLILKAYGIQLYQLSAPDWTRTESATFDLVAKMPPGSTPEQVPEMLQTLLKDRFKLSAHRENRDSQVYVLVLGKNRPRMKAAPPDAPYAFQMLPRPDGIYHFQLTASLASFVQNVASYVGRPVFDRTGLKGIYEFAMDVSPGDSTTALPQGPEFVSAVEQLGLKLELRKESLQMIVVDHIEKMPTEN